jgi:DNA-directed RNA polymerase specialized sigma24 family protein
VGQGVESEALRAALAALPDRWRRVVILRDVEGRPAAQVSAATGLSAEQQRDVLNRARELLREDVGRAFEQHSGRS